MTATKYVSIANGIYVPTRVKLSMLEEYKLKQSTCMHSKRDPKGMCYECGHRQ